MNTYAIDVNTSRIPETGAHDPISWPNGLFIVIIIIFKSCGLQLHNSNWPNTRLINIVIIIGKSFSLAA